MVLLPPRSPRPTARRRSGTTMKPGAKPSRWKTISGSFGGHAGRDGWTKER